MARIIAHKTLEAIDRAMCADGGNTYRRMLGVVMPQMQDAYRDDEDDYRTHLGASVIGDTCERSVFYSWKWAHKAPPRGKKGEPAQRAESRMRRLWNRGHLEEARFIALLLSIGVRIYQQDETGKQYRIAAHGGHFGGSGDGIGVGFPDLPADVPALTEFKTHSEKSFLKLVEEGVRESKPTHYVQMQEYMHHMGLLYAIYFAVNKNTDELYAEIVTYDRPCAEHYLERARRIIFDVALPQRIRGGSPGFMQCKYLCDFTDVCFKTKEPDRNCRTCEHSLATEAGVWVCNKNSEPAVLSKQDQIAGCGAYQLAKVFK